MEGENITDPPYTVAASTGQGIFSHPPPSGSVLSTSSSVFPGSKSQPELKEQPSMPIASIGFVSQSGPSSVTAQWSYNAAAFSNVNPMPQASHMLPNPAFGRPGTLAPPGLMTSPPAFHVSNPFSTTPRPGMSAGPAQINPCIYPHMYPPYHALPTMHGMPQGMWLQPPPMGGIPRAPFLSHPTPFPGSYPFTVHGIPPNLPYSGSQPLGAITMESAGTVNALPGHNHDSSHGQKTEALRNWYAQGFMIDY